MNDEIDSSHETYLMEEIMSGINVGIALPTREVAMMGYNDAAPLLKITRQVEELGYDAIWAGDSFVARHRLEPMSLLAAVAMITERVTIGTAAITAVSREPLSLAHTIVTLDQLSGGRLRLGIGTGAPLPVQSEYDAITMTYRERRERVDEMVTAWRTVWNNEDGDLVGKYYKLNGLRDQPPPLQAGGPPLWLASNGKPRAVTRIADHYDGWMPILPNAEDYGLYWDNIREAVAAKGRDPQDIARCLYVTVNINQDAEKGREGLDAYTHRYNDLPLSAMAEYQLYFGGSEEAFVEWLTEYVNAGAQNIILRLGAYEDFDYHLNAIAKGVLPALKEL
jgi:alkanesulfonate monooxygenase SsuD/methylene tetrahydromethanopterin reductase-like flavin-dependent oxidoreductase (luciferase family)